MWWTLKTCLKVTRWKTEPAISHSPLCKYHHFVKWHFNFLQKVVFKINFHLPLLSQQYQVSKGRKRPTLKLLKKHLLGRFFIASIFIQSGPCHKIPLLNIKKYYYRKFWITLNLLVDKFKFFLKSTKETDRFMCFCNARILCLRKQNCIWIRHKLLDSNLKGTVSYNHFLF